MLANFCTPAFLFSHGAIQGSVCHHVLGGASEGVGHSQVDGEQACCESFEAFSEEMRKVFDCLARGIEAARALSVLQQGEQSVRTVKSEM